MPRWDYLHISFVATWLVAKIWAVWSIVRETVHLVFTLRLFSRFILHNVQVKFLLCNIFVGWKNTWKKILYCNVEDVNNIHFFADRLQINTSTTNALSNFRVSLISANITDIVFSRLIYDLWTAVYYCCLYSKLSKSRPFSKIVTWVWRITLSAS